MATALLAGSFDPITLGHLDLLRRTLAFVDRVVVGVAVNASKQPLFTLDERSALIEGAVAAFPADERARVEVRHFQGLLVDFAREVGATVSVRGVRALSDFDYEYGMALMNRHIAPAMDTIFLPPSAPTAFVSSTLVREVSRLGGDVSALVPANVAAALAARFPR